jgi:hypothetical protein
VGAALSASKSSIDCIGTSPFESQIAPTLFPLLLFHAAERPRGSDLKTSDLRAYCTVTVMLDCTLPRIAVTAVLPGVSPLSWPLYG